MILPLFSLSLCALSTADYLVRSVTVNSVNYDDFSLLCAEGIPLLMQDHKPRPCQPRPWREEQKCPIGFWCHEGEGDSSYYCCPNSRKVKNHCHLPAATGYGKELMRRFYYDWQTDGCHELQYTGIGGNNNSYMTYEKCEADCRGSGQPARTRIAVKPSTNGTLTGKPVKVNKETKKKIKTTRKERPTTTTRRIEKVYISTRPPTTATTGTKVPLRPLTTKSHTKTTTQTTSATPLPPTVAATSTAGMSQAVDPCSQSPEKGTSGGVARKMWYFDQSAKSCILFTYLGKGGNSNKFASSETCMGVCGIGKPTRKACRTPPSIGDGPYKVPRYYFDTTTKQCELFYYSGQNGNDNRFYRKYKCERLCLGRKKKKKEKTDPPEAVTTPTRPAWRTVQSLVHSEQTTGYPEGVETPLLVEKAHPTLVYVPTELTPTPSTLSPILEPETFDFTNSPHIDHVFSNLMNAKVTPVDNLFATYATARPGPVFPPPGHKHPSGELSFQSINRPVTVAPVVSSATEYIPWSNTGGQETSERQPISNQFGQNWEVPGTLPTSWQSAATTTATQKPYITVEHIPDPAAVNNGQSSRVGWTSVNTELPTTATTYSQLGGATQQQYQGNMEVPITTVTEFIPGEQNGSEQLVINSIPTWQSIDHQLVNSKQPNQPIQIELVQSAQPKTPIQVEMITQSAPAPSLPKINIVHSNTQSNVPIQGNSNRNEVPTSAPVRWNTLPVVQETPLVISNARPNSFNQQPQTWNGAQTAVPLVDGMNGGLPRTKTLQSLPVGQVGQNTQSETMGFPTLRTENPVIPISWSNAPVSVTTPTLPTTMKPTYSQLGGNVDQSSQSNSEIPINIVLTGSTTRPSPPLHVHTLVNGIGSPPHVQSNVNIPSAQPNVQNSVNVNAEPKDFRLSLIPTDTYTFNLTEAWNQKQPEGKLPTFSGYPEAISYTQQATYATLATPAPVVASRQPLAPSTSGFRLEIRTEAPPTTKPNITIQIVESYLNSPCRSPLFNDVVIKCADSDVICPSGTFCQVGEGQSMCCPANEGPVCQQSLEHGIGPSRLQRWFYDPATTHCHTFMFAGFQGNQNNFRTFAECRQSCNAKNPCTTGVPIASQNSTASCSAGNPCPAGSMCHSIDTHSVCCPTKDGQKQDPCSQPVDKGTGKGAHHRWGFDPGTQTCISFLFGGRGGNKNNFITKKDCQKICPGKSSSPSPTLVPASLPSKCMQPPHSGHGQKFLARYFYSPEYRQCLHFIYSGEGANENNFLTQQECLETCVANGVKFSSLGTTAPTFSFSFLPAPVCPQGNVLTDSQGRAVSCGAHNRYACPSGNVCRSTGEASFCCPSPDSFCLEQRPPLSVCPSGGMPVKEIRFTYDAAADKCIRFTFSNCAPSTSLNLFNNKPQCMRLCCNQGYNLMYKRKLVRVARHSRHAHNGTLNVDD